MPSIFLKSDTSKTANASALTIPEPAVIVTFRPGGNYTGKDYGFDWVRDSEFKDSFTYEDITDQFDDLLSRFPDREGNLMELTNFGRKKYAVPVLSLRADYTKEVPIDVKVEVKKKPQKIELKFDNKKLTVNINAIEDCSIGVRELDNHMKITCASEFDEDQFIEVYADDQIVGALRVVANDIKHRYHLKILVINVSTRLNTRAQTGALDSVESGILDRTLNHFLATTESIDVDLNLTVKKLREEFLADYSMVDGGKNIIQYSNNLMSFLDEQLKGAIDSSTVISTKYPDLKDEYADYYKMFVFDNSCIAMVSDGHGGTEKFGVGGVMPIGTHAGAMFGSRKDTTYPHELMHGLGLLHTFSSSAPIKFEKLKTDNIMDYSTVRWSTSYMQWLKAWELHDAKRESDERPRLYNQSEDEST